MRFNGARFGGLLTASLLTAGLMALLITLLSLPVSPLWPVLLGVLAAATVCLTEGTRLSWLPDAAWMAGCLLTVLALPGTVTNGLAQLLDADAVHAKQKKLSADVFPGPKSYAEWMVRQQWNNWKLDAVFPMNYNDFYMEPAAWVGKVTKEEVEAMKGKNTLLYSGIFICHDWRHKDKVVDPENSGLLPSEIAEAVQSSMAAGADGISIFTPNDMTEEHWTELEKVLKELSK